LKSPNKSFLSNVTVLLGGTLIAQILAVISLPFLQKYFYSPEDFAIFTWFFELAAIFVGISALRIETGIVLEKDTSSALKLVKLCLALVVLFSIFFTVVVLLLSLFFENFKLFSSNLIYLILLTFTILFLSGTQVLTSYFTRQQKFKELASNKVFQTSFTILPQFIFGGLKMNSSGLVLGKIIGGAASFFALLLRIKSELKTVSFPSKKERKELFKNNIDFILYTTPGTFLGMFINFIFIDLFLMYFGESITGQLGASKHYVGMAFSVLSTSFAQVFYSKIATINDKIELRKFYTYWLIRLSGIGALAIAVLYSIPNSWIISFLGQKWSELLPVMQVMVLWMAVMFVASSLSYIYIKLNRQKTVIFFDVIHLILVTTSITVSYHLYHDFFITLYWFTISKIILYLIAIGITYFFINRYEFQQEDNSESTN
jgi:O-antigen/teichoic acid export membrane protein